jgi:hypothetical protein
LAEGSGQEDTEARRLDLVSRFAFVLVWMGMRMFLVELDLGPRETSGAGRFGQHRDRSEKEEFVLLKK